MSKYKYSHSYTIEEQPIKKMSWKEKVLDAAKRGVRKAKYNIGEKIKDEKALRSRLADVRKKEREHILIKRTKENVRAKYKRPKNFFNTSIVEKKKKNPNFHKWL